MSDVVVVPEWDLADRLIKARRHAELSRPELAEYLGVSRNSMSSYETGKTMPPLSVMRVWALRCGVPLDWLRYGDAPPMPEVTAGPRPRPKRVDRRKSTGWLTARAVAVAA
jgi:transcriptional regulator with XRE-family HTH domain